MLMGIKKDIKIANEQRKNHKYCEYCGHTMTFYAFEKDRKLCSFCGRYNYKNDLVKFRYNLMKTKRRMELKCQ